MANIRLPEHSHCIFCGDPIPFGEEYCDDECRKAEADRVAKENRRNYIFWGAAGIVIIAVFIAKLLTR